MSFLKSLFARLSAFWHNPMPPERLAVVRIAVGLYSLYYLLPRWKMFYGIARTSPELFDPVGIARLLESPLPPILLDGLYLLTVAAALAVTIGLTIRISGPLFALSLLALLCYRNSWSMILHMHNGLVVHALIIGFTPSADVWSFDSWRKQRSTSARRRAAIAPSWRYGWPIQLVTATALVSYLLSGVAKAVGPQGLEWATGATLRAQIAVNAIRYDVLTEVGSTPLFHGLFAHEWIFWLMGIGTFVLELGAPVALLHRGVGRLWAIAALGLHWGIFFTMGIKFRYQMSGAAFVAFFDWEYLSRTRRSPQDRVKCTAEPADQQGSAASAASGVGWAGLAGPEPR